jgi:murein DD-endopeptidase MepM/ murein hydrolase activator NlpD
MGAFVLLGLVLIVRSPRHPSEPPPPAAKEETVTTAALVVPAASASAAPSAAPATPPAPKFVPTWRVSALKADTNVEIVEGTYGKRSLQAVLAAAGLARGETKRLVHAFEGVHHIEHPPPNDRYVVAKDRAKGTIVAFEHVASPTEIWQAKSDDDHRLVSRKLELFVERKPIAASLAITSDLGKAIAAANLRQDALAALDDALDGHVDVATIKPGSRLRVVGNEEWVEGAFARVRVDAVEVEAKGSPPQRIYFYEREGSKHHGAFWNAKGQQPYEGSGFRSPLPLARITSRFNPHRMHPVLHVVMPHNGVDFGATTGTPVYASAAGVVSTAGDSGPCGNMVQIDHANGLTTAYCHLSRFAAGLHPGQHVEARQLVGYVGQSGRATGPHLHFAVKRGGTFIDPMGLKMDGVRVLPAADRDAFAQRKESLDTALDAIAQAPAADVPDEPAKDDKDDEPAGEE